MHRIHLRSPAKVNLYLKVINRRPDGYHNIITLFERINLYDDITFSLNKTGRIHIDCDHPQVPTGKKNLIYKTAHLLKQKYDIKEGVNIKIKKRIPVAAGLAGGSSNAATALRALNQLWGLQLSQNHLMKYARHLGSDVAFFLHDTKFALGTQRGDHIKDLSINYKLWHILVIPQIKLYAKDVYKILQTGSTNLLTKNKVNVNILLHYLRKSNFLKIEEFLINDLEKAAVRLYPGLLKLKERLKSLGCKGVMVSGSGPCVFGLTETKGQAKKIQSILARRFSQVYVADTI